MKTTLFTFAALALVSLLVGCDETPVATGVGDKSASTPAVVAGDVNTVSFNVPGMTCAGCAAMVEETLVSTEGIEACTVNLDAKLATVKINPDKFQAEDVLKALADAGYKDSTVKN